MVGPPSSDYDYDVFISYRHKDRLWVEETLLPRLRSWGVIYCVDFEMFSGGIPFEQEMNRLIQRSRQTVVVLTGSWFEKGIPAGVPGLTGGFTNAPAKLTAGPRG